MKHILLIDPDISALSLTQRFLENYGFKVKTCTEVARALEILPLHKFDLILSELEMKGLDGFDFNRIVKRFFSSIPLVLLTARDDNATRKEAQFAGITDFISKQTEYTSIPRKINRILHSEIPMAS